MEFVKTLWSYWKQFGTFLGDMVGRFFLSVFYLTVTLPFGLGVSLFGDPLRIKQRQAPGAWVERVTLPATIEASLEQH